MEEGFMSILGVVVGGLIGFCSSYIIQWAQRRDERRSIALGFKKELEIYRDWLAPTAQILRKGSFFETEKVLDRPINTSNSLYYILRKEMFRLNSDTVGSLLLFYSHLFTAEEERRKALVSWPTTIGASSTPLDNIIQLPTPR